MSEFPLSSTEECPKRKKTTFCSLILSDFHLFCSLVLSHPLYFSYVLFFSPYIIKILSFLSPLFLTTTLLLLALLSTLLHDTCSDPEFPESQSSLLFSSCSGVLRSNFDVKDETPMSLEELEAYQMVFEACLPEILSETETETETDTEETCSTTELPFVDKFCSHESTGEAGTVSEALWEVTNEDEAEIPRSKTEDLMNLEEEIVKCEKEEEEVKPINGTVPDKDEGDSWEMPTKMESKAQKVGDEENSNDEECELPKLSHFLGKISGDEVEKENADSHKTREIITLSSFGSMRKEKEWRRTLACKLFEERHSVASAGATAGGGGGGDDGGENMDLLWEAYETHIDKTPSRLEEKKKTKKSEKQKPQKVKSKKNIEEIYQHKAHDDDGDDGDDGGEQLCCLHALKFSTGKMNLGIARPNLLRLSKAFKGFGRFHSAASKHSKKA
ncbi:PREDICTED: uncharacterized protein LOC104804626 [Tarenaya hassleriana]|uniref:uncharacterized protein LOC104804626 n=1 Tax=Tarenaya hassleriana TaxID=28532 RepID=UPI00053C6A3C|nr:PREDICTED: uncharacterized protein LOC104804626 [Tarenaya hassleriana]